MPDDFELFLQLHLGLNPDGTALLANADQLAERHGVTPEALQTQLRAAQIDAVTVDETDYDLGGQHAEAQVLALLGDATETLAFAHKVYADYRARLGHKRARFDDEHADKTVSERIEISDVPHRRQ